MAQTGSRAKLPQGALDVRNAVAARLERQWQGIDVSIPGYGAIL
jgi:hypothetical protein